MPQHAPTLSTSRAGQRKLRKLSPFELKDRLISLATGSIESDGGSRSSSEARGCCSRGSHGRCSACTDTSVARLLVQASGTSERMALEHYQAAFWPMLAGVVVAMVLTVLLRETGPAAHARPR
jgi:hypothetical protein